MTFKLSPVESILGFKTVKGVIELKLEYAYEFSF